jgi:glycosyltransferase involved in cell wall biosynthesis
MKISILVSDMSKNTLGRPYLLARVLSRSYQVEVIGPLFGSRIWPPCDTDELEYKTVPGMGFPGFFRSIPKLLSLITGDVIYAAAPRLPDFGTALMKRVSTNKPVVLDIDEWQMGLLLNNGRFDYFKSSIRNIRIPNSHLYYWLMEYLIPLSNQITVASDFLQQKFGGVKVPHGRDTDSLSPDMFNPETERASLELADCQYIVFLGTPLPHKGLEDIIKALSLLNNKDLRLLIVGADPKIDYVHNYVEYLRQTGKDWVEIRESCSVSDIPRYLSVASLVVLPQQKTSQFIGQVPAKLFDAMAMAKPIISTKVTEIPEILKGCGWLVEPQDIESLTACIEYVITHPDEARSMGVKARTRCIERYSWDSIEGTLVNIFDQFAR